MATPLQNVKIGQIISRQVITVTPDTPVADAIAVMADSRISSLVIAQGKIPEGIFTERDVVRWMSRGTGLLRRPISEVMTSPVLTIPGNLNLYEAYNLLLTNRIRHHVVVDRSGRLMGILSQSDIVNHLGLEFFVEMRKVEQVMSPTVVTVPREMPVHEALQIMAGKGISCIVVADSERPAGILTERDVTRLVVSQADLSHGTVEKVMTAPVMTLPVGTTVHAAAVIMREQGIRRVVVVDDERISGLITQSDIVKGLEGKYIESLKKIIKDKEDVLRETARELLDKSVYLDGILTSSIDLAIVATDVDFRIRYFNPVAEKVFQRHAEDVHDRSVAELDDLRIKSESRLDRAREIVRKKGEYHFPMRITRDGGTRHYEGRVTGIKDRLNRLAGFVLMLRDVTERKFYEDAIRRMAYHDSLTGLPNRVLLADRVTHALAFAARNVTQGAVMILDLDRFKEINDTYGHGIGDQLLQGVALRLKELLRKSDTIARLGGDEFVVLLPRINSADGAGTIAAKIVAAFSHPFPCGNDELTVSPSIGIAVFPDDGDEQELLLKRADIALYRAKEEGRNTFRRY